MREGGKEIRRSKLDKIKGMPSYKETVTLQSHRGQLNFPISPDSHVVTQWRREGGNIYEIQAIRLDASWHSLAQLWSWMDKYSSSGLKNRTVMSVCVTPPGEPRRGSRGPSWRGRVSRMKNGGKRWRVSVVISKPTGDVHLINIDLLSFLQEESLMESWRCCPLNIYEEMGLSGIRVISEGYRQVLCRSSFKERFSSVALLWGVLATRSGISSATENSPARSHDFLERPSTND